MNRREFLSNFTSGLATTAVLSVSARAAFGGMFPGQSENEISNGSSMFPSGELVIPSESNMSDSVNDDVNSGLNETKHYLCSFNTRILLENIMTGLPACPRSDWNDQYGQILRQAIDYLHHRPDHYVVGPKPGSQNATAYFCGVGGHRKKAIDWDPQFLWQLSQQAGTSNAAIAILLHELGHHVNSDISIQTGPDRELWADSFAGFHLARVNVPQNEAVAVFYLMGSGGATHPPSEQRVAAAAAGWQKGMLQKQRGL